MPWHPWKRHKPSKSAPPGRRLVIGDVHGCARTLRVLLNGLIGVKRGDSLYFLGDLVSKGPNSGGVLDAILELETRGVSVALIRGNHEESILSTAGGKPSAMRKLLAQTNNATLATETEPGRMVPRFQGLLERAVPYVLLRDAILVHGGVDLRSEQPFSDHHALIHARISVFDAERAGGRSIVHGHTRAPLERIIQAVSNRDAVVPLDNGMMHADPVHPHRISEYGNLCALDLDRRVLFVQPNLDLDRKQGDASFGLCVYPESRTDL